VLHRTYANQDCSVARALEVVGERWTILILRDALNGVRRFDDFQRSLGIARNVLQTRLEHLVAEGLLERRPYQERPRRHEYRPTDRGLDLWPAIVALMKWGDRHLADDGPPRVALHAGCGGELTESCTCAACGAALTARDVELRDGPGRRAA
jgi:DNA-binding HxlR family transcriptional regulator